MTPINADQLLNQIRSLGAELQPTAIPESTPTANFGDMLKSSLDSVNEAQQTAGELKSGFISGSNDASLVEVMVAAQKADLSFRAVTEVRNKLITAYQDIMNMPV
ncbi:MAG: flagellar hook-basal body complex protein FliE [Gammaproteobacteria bacterium]|nr:flagellar hook-basal body complex protein FliE [Gammaproteobacteria bacterium]